MTTYDNFREIIFFLLGLLLIIYASLNINISSPPSDLKDIPNNYGKTFCIKINTADVPFEKNRQIIQNAFILEMIAMASGILLILLSGPPVIKILSKQFKKSANNVQRF